MTWEILKKQKHRRAPAARRKPAGGPGIYHKAINAAKNIRRIMHGRITEGTIMADIMAEVNHVKKIYRLNIKELKN